MEGMASESIKPLDIQTIVVPIARQLGHRFWDGKTEVTRPDFAEVLQLMQQFRAKRWKASEPEGSWIAEAEHRLEQVAYWVQSVEALQRRCAKATRWNDADSKERRKLKDQIGERLGSQIDAHAHAFYWFAWRLCTIIEDILKLEFKTPKNILLVRNNLIEHPENKGSGAANPNFVYGVDIPWGPIIKPFGPRSGPNHDDGLYVNANQLIERLSAALRQELSKP
jgi:hypothetical protein